MAIKTNSKKSRKTQKDALGSQNNHQKALELAEAGKHEEALGYMQEYLSSSPNDAEVLNDTGAILHCLNRSEEAIKHLVKARSLQPDSAEIIWNLSETYLAADKLKEAMEFFDDMERIGILNADVLNRTADILLNTGNLSGALEMLHRSLELSPNQEILQPMIEVIRHRMVKNSRE